MIRLRAASPSSLAAFVLTAALLPAQVVVTVTTLQPLEVDARIQGDTTQIASIPAGIDVTSAPPLVATSTWAGHTGFTAWSTGVTTTSLGTTVEIGVESRFITWPTNLGFDAHASGSHVIAFTSPIAVAGALVIEPFLHTTSGYGGFSVNTMTCDVGNDGSVDVSLTTPSWMNLGHDCVLQSGQPLVVRVDHHHEFSADTIGEWTARMRVRFIPHADALGTYGAGCSATLVRHLFDGGTELMIGMSSPQSDLHLLAFGLAPAVTPLAQSTCPLLTSTDVVLGPFVPNWLHLPHAILPPGLTVHLQLYGLHTPTGNLHGTRGITMTGQ